MSLSKTDAMTAAVANLVTQGYCNHEIAAHLHIGYNSVKAYVYRAGLRSVRKPGHHMPECRGCRLATPCMRSIVKGRAFARPECNPVQESR
jgi:FixJ family two-component response regulator